MQTMLRNCQKSDQSKDLAALLNRDAENLQTRILGGMVKRGQLVLRFPDVPNRPYQAYPCHIDIQNT
jgi:hypothetical protein